jgi:hypothetical protein
VRSTKSRMVIHGAKHVPENFQYREIRVVAR